MNVSIIVEARDSDDELLMDIRGRQFFAEKEKQLAYQEKMIMAAADAFTKVSLETRKEEQGV